MISSGEKRFFSQAFGFSEGRVPLTFANHYAGQVYVSMRGTQEPADFAADADLASSGLAHQQLADMVNWWLRATTAPLTDADTPQYATQITVAPNGDFTLAAPVLGTGTLLGIGAIKSVNGHSLGCLLYTSPSPRD